MINRELIRTRAVQLTYAYFQNPLSDLDVAERTMERSLNEAYRLYHTLLRLIVDITGVARRQHDIDCQRAERAGTPVPSDRFCRNAFAEQLERNTQLGDYTEEHGNLWREHQDAVIALYRRITQSEPYILYMEGPATDYAADRELWRVLYRTIIAGSDEVGTAIEEDSLYWNDDREVIDTFVLKTIRRFTPETGAEQPLLPPYSDDTDREFATQLFHAAITGVDEYQQYMAEASKGWDFKRLAYMDVVIMQLAIAEMMTFPAIPVQVTIREYVALAALYSTPRSGRYVNGMLDTIARHLIETGILHKPMPERRGRTKDEASDNDNIRDCAQNLNS